ncbi:MAG: carbohydrate-binding module family 20 domain-containing protein [Fidelibacterota bacterium]
MKKRYLLLAILSFATYSFATNVTFRLNMSTYSDGATDSTSTVHVRGSFNGWADGNPLANDGGDYWSTTIELTAGETVEYKFTHLDDLGNLTWESIDNRTYLVPSADTLMDLAYWDNNAPYTPTDDLEVYFRVNMSGVVGYAGEQVDVRGGFNGWAAGDDLIQEGDGSDFWSGVIIIPSTDAGTTHEYKFTYYDESTTNWESIDNRSVTVNQDTTLAWKWFNDEPPIEAEIDTFTVTFICNTATLDNITDSTIAGFYVSGSMNGWSQNDSATAAGDYWSATTDIVGTTDGADIEYKFRYTDLAGLEFWESISNRTATITSDTTLPLHWWDDIAPFEPTADLDIWFRVNMSAVFDDFDFVDVRGSFNGWSAGDTLVPEENAGFWSGLISIPDSTAGETQEYKFVYVDPDGGVHWESIDNRSVVINQDTTLAFAYFDNIPPQEEEPVTAFVYWTVDMEAYETMDLFSPTRDDTMQTRGGFNGWSSTADPDGSNINMTRIAGTSIYELNVPLTMYAGTEDAYKYYIKLSNESLDLIQSINPYFFEDMGYENPPTMGAGNRSYIFEGDSTQAQVIGLEYYNDIPPDGLIPEGQSIDLSFNLDMSSAANLGFDATEDTVWLLFKDEWAEHIQGFSIADNSHHPDLILTDPDSDGIFSVTFSVTGYTPYSMVYVYEFGDNVGGYLQEGGGFDYGRYRCRYIQPASIDPISWPSAFTFPQDTWTTDPPLTVETPPDLGAADDPVNIPSEFKVSQNYPNPFNPSTEIRFSLPEADKVTFTIYNIMGQKVTVYKRDFPAPGNYGLKWNGTDHHGVPAASGVYFYELKTSKHSVVKKMTLLR